MSGAALFVTAVLFGGPFDGESRRVAVDESLAPPDDIKLLDMTSTMEAIIETVSGDPVPIAYQVYARESCTKAGIWRYNFKDVFRGRLVIES